MLEAKNISDTLDTLTTKYAHLYPGGTSRKHGQTEDGWERKKVGHSRRKAPRQKIKRAKEKLKTVLPRIAPRYIPTFEEKKEKSILDIECTPKGVANVDIDQLQNLQSYDVVALVSACESGVFTHEAKCLILDCMPGALSKHYWELYDKEYGSDTVDTSDDDTDMYYSPDEEDNVS